MDNYLDPELQKTCKDLKAAISAQLRKNIEEMRRTLLYLQDEEQRIKEFTTGVEIFPREECDTEILRNNGIKQEPRSVNPVSANSPASDHQERQPKASPQRDREEESSQPKKQLPETKRSINKLKKNFKAKARFICKWKTENSPANVNNTANEIIDRGSYSSFTFIKSEPTSEDPEPSTSNAEDPRSRDDKKSI